MSLNTITGQFGFATPEPASLIINRESLPDGTFGFSWQKFPFLHFPSQRRIFSSKEESEAAMQRFIEQTRQREPYLLIVVQ